MQFKIDRAEALCIADAEIANLLHEVYVGEGFTTRERGNILFEPSAVRGRGYLICARPHGIEKLAGMIIVVPPDSHVRRMANADEAELHLLAVDAACRGKGLGRALLQAAIDATAELGFRKLVLWTQPAMMAAHGLYASAGFVRVPDRDPDINGLRFLVYEKQW